MRERLGAALVVVALAVAWGVGFLWFHGDLRPASSQARAGHANPTMSAAPTPAPSPSSTAVGDSAPRPTGAAAPAGTTRSGAAYARVTPLQERRAVDLNPRPARPAPRALAPVADWTMATFNLLGSSHTAGRSARASGPQRINGALQILAQHQISVVGLQEFQPNQRAAFAQRASGWTMWPGLSMGRRAGENSMAWRTDTWEPVRTGLTPIPYFNGHIRPMPYVLLRHRATGVLAWFSTFHNPADALGFTHQQRFRSEAMRREIALVHRLEETGSPVFVTGDMNERAEYFCAMTGQTDLVAAAGGSHEGGCRPPARPQIDWIFGSPQAVFDSYVIDRGPLVRRTTDHPVVLAHVTVDALRFRHGFVAGP